MFLHLLTQVDRALVDEFRVSLAVFYQLMEVAELEDPVRIDLEVLAETRAVCFD